MSQVSTVGAFTPPFIPAFAMPRAELMKVLQSSLYPGAADASVEMVIGYCQAQGLDPLQKPVHIVPMKVKTGKKNKYGDDEYAQRDVIMPGVGLYRTQASRTGAYAGMTEPEFGPNQDLLYQKEFWTDGPNGKRVKKYVDDTLEYPEWCKIGVKRLVGGQERTFWALEFWIENYASKGEGQPNAMWLKRPRGQLAKCAEAQALRKAFPELGSAPTAEEMEGRTFEHDDANVPAKQENPFLPVDKPAEPAAVAGVAPIMDVDTATGEVLQHAPEPVAETSGGKAEPAPVTTTAPAGEVKLASASMVATVTNKMKRKNLTDDVLLAKFGFRLTGMPMAKVNDVIAWASA